MPCTSLRIEVTPLVGAEVAARDATNLIVFRNEHWCHNESCEAGSEFPSLAAAMTTTYPAAARGRDVLEADIEINAVGYSFALGTAPHATLQVGTESQVVPLQAILLHEIGHLIGLEDSCAQHSVSGVLRVVGCASDEQDSVMFSQATHTELTGRDAERVCELFPLEGATLAAPLQSPGAGAAAEDWPATVVPLVAVFGLGVVWRLLERVS